MKLSEIVRHVAENPDARVLVRDPNGKLVTANQAVMLYNGEPGVTAATSVIITTDAAEKAVGLIDWTKLPDIKKSPTVVEFEDNEQPDCTMLVQFKLHNIDPVRFLEWLKVECSVAEDGDGSMHDHCTGPKRSCQVEVVGKVGVEYDPRDIGGAD